MNEENFIITEDGEEYQASSKYEMLAFNLLSKNSFGTYNKFIGHQWGLETSIFIAEIFEKYRYFKSKKQLDKDGYFFNTAENIKRDTVLSRYQQSQAIKKLESLDILKIKKKGVPPKLWFLLNHKTFYFQFLKFLKLNLKDLNYINDIKDNDVKSISKEIHTSLGKDVCSKDNSSKKKMGKLSLEEKEDIELKIKRNKTVRKVLKRWNTFQDVTKHKTPNKTWLEILKKINYLKSGKMSKFPFEDDFLKRNKIPKDFLSHKFTEKEILKIIKKIPSFLQEGYFMKEKKFSKSLPNIIFNPYSKIQSIFLMAYFNEAKPIAENIIVECQFPKIAEIVKNRFKLDFEKLTAKEKKEFNQNLTEIKRRTELASTRLGFGYHLRFYDFLRLYFDLFERDCVHGILDRGEKITPYYFSVHSWTYKKIIADIHHPLPYMRPYMEEK